MTDTTSELKVTAASDIEVDRDALDNSIREFAEVNGDYYIGAFHKIHDATGVLPNTFNLWAAVLGPLWAASRAIWGMFWTFLILEVIAWVQIGRGWWGNPGADMAERAARQGARAQELLDKAAAATEQADIDRFNKLASNIQAAADKSMEQATAAQSEAFGIMLTGFLLLLFFKLVQGIYADRAYEKQYSNWRIDPENTESGRSQRNTIMGAVLAAAIGPLIVYKFTVNKSMALLDAFPEERASALFLGEGNGTLFSRLASWMEARIDAAAAAGGDVFDGIVTGVRTVLDALTLALNGSPWPVVMLVICVTAWRAAGPRVAIFTAAALAYTALLGYWEVAMETVALVGAVGDPLRGDRHPARHLVRQVAARLQGRRTGARPDADPARLRLSHPDHRVFRHRQPAGHSGHDHLRHAAGDPPDRPWHARGARKHQGGRGGLRCLQVAIAQGRGNPPRAAVDHDRGEPDHPDVSVDGGDHLADRGRRTGQGNPRGAAICRQGARPAGRFRHPLPRHGHGPDRAGRVPARGSEGLGVARTPR